VDAPPSLWSCSESLLNRLLAAISEGRAQSVKRVFSKIPVSTEFGARELLEELLPILVYVSIGRLEESWHKRIFLPNASVSGSTSLPLDRAKTPKALFLLWKLA
jgi:hypothetical protein